MYIRVSQSRKAGAIRPRLPKKTRESCRCFGSGLRPLIFKRHISRTNLMERSIGNRLVESRQLYKMSEPYRTTS